MGWTISPKVGDGEFDICEDCEHRDCALNRRLVASQCMACGELIGAGTAFYTMEAGRYDPPDRFIHARCVERN